MSDFLKLSREKLNDRMTELKSAYVKFVVGNPALVNQIEKTAKTSSYLFDALSKNYETSIFVTEFLSSACNLFSYFNSHIFLKSKKIFTNSDGNELVEKIKQVLSVVEFSQAFLEISARKIGGSGARWAVITIICLVKTILRCVLLFLFDSGIQSHSLTTLVKTTSFISSSIDKEKDSEGESKSAEPEVIYVGSRTGHKMKTLDASSSNSGWSSQGGGANMINLPPTPLTPAEKIGECLHAVRPLLHVLASGLFGTKSSVPWLTALLMDSSSHVLLQRTTQSPTNTQRSYNHAELSELRRRYANLLLYLVRSPMYDKFTEPRLLKVCSYLSENVPLARYIVQPFSEYLPEWQKLYFYTWTD